MKKKLVIISLILGALMLFQQHGECGVGRFRDRTVQRLHREGQGPRQWQRQRQRQDRRQRAASAGVVSGCPSHPCRLQRLRLLLTRFTAKAESARLERARCPYTPGRSPLRQKGLAGCRASRELHSVGDGTVARQAGGPVPRCCARCIRKRCPPGRCR